MPGMVASSEGLKIKIIDSADSSSKLQEEHNKLPTPNQLDTSLISIHKNGLNADL